MVDPAVKPNLLKKEEANEYDEDEVCRANIRTGQECVNAKTDKEPSSEMDAESVNTDSEMFDPRCRPSEKTSEKPIELNKQENDDDSELSAPAVIASASHSSGVVGVLVAMQRHAPVTQTAQETMSMSQRSWQGSHCWEERCAMHRRARVCVMVVSTHLQYLSAVSTAQDDASR